MSIDLAAIRVRADESTMRCEVRGCPDLAINNTWLRWQSRRPNGGNSIGIHYLCGAHTTALDAIGLVYQCDPISQRDIDLHTGAWLRDAPPPPPPAPRPEPLPVVLDLDALRARAHAASVLARPDTAMAYEHDVWSVDERGGMGYDIDGTESATRGQFASRDVAAHIAGLSPPTVLALLAEIKRLRALVGPEASPAAGGLLPNAVSSDMRPLRIIGYHHRAVRRMPPEDLQGMCVGLAQVGNWASRTASLASRGGMSAMLGS